MITYLPEDSIQVISGALSVMGSCLVLFALRFAPLWRSRVPPIKWLLGVTSIFNLLTGMNYLYKTEEKNQICLMQAIIMQFFELCGAMYALMMAVETYALIQVISRHERIVTPATYKRHMVYHFIVMGLGLGTCLWIGITDNYISSGGWCWIEDNYFKVYFGYIPVWFSAVGIAIIDSMIAFRMIQSARQMKALKMRNPTNDVEVLESGLSPLKTSYILYNNSSTSRNSSSQLNDVATPSTDDFEMTRVSGKGRYPLNELEVKEQASSKLLSVKLLGRTASSSSNSNHVRSMSTQSVMTSPKDAVLEKEAEIEAKFQAMLVRLLLYPVLLAVLVIPGSYNRIYSIIHSTHDHGNREGEQEASEFFGYAQRFCDPARGMLNAIVWILSDIDVRTELRNSLRSSVPWWRARWLRFWYGIELNTLNGKPEAPLVPVVLSNSEYTLTIEPDAAAKRRSARLQERQVSRFASVPTTTSTNDHNSNSSNNSSSNENSSHENVPFADDNSPTKLGGINNTTPVGTESGTATATTTSTISSAVLPTTATAKVTYYTSSSTANTARDEADPVPYGHFDKEYILEQLHAANMTPEDSRRSTGNSDADSLSALVGGYGVVPSGSFVGRDTSGGDSRSSFQYY